MQQALQVVSRYNEVQAVRQSMPFIANHAIVHAVVIRAEPHKHTGLGLNDRNTPAQSAYERLDFSSVTNFLRCRCRNVWGRS